MLTLLGALLQFVLLMGVAALLALLLGAAFASASKSRWWKHWAAGSVALAGGSGSPFGDQGSQREATLKKRGDDDVSTSGGDDGGAGGD